jgi:hypothetical protein
MSVSSADVWCSLIPLIPYLPSPLQSPRGRAIEILDGKVNKTPHHMLKYLPP